MARAHRIPQPRINVSEGEELELECSLHVSPRSLAPCPCCLWRTRLKILPGVGISTRAVGGGVSASPGQGALLIDFAEATGALPTDLALFGTGAVSFSVADVASFCVAPVEWSPELYPSSAPVQLDLVTGAVQSPPSGPLRKSSAKERRESRPPPLRSHEVFAERLGFINREVPCRSPTSLTGVDSFVVPPSYEPLDESVRLSAVRRRAIMKLREPPRHRVGRVRLAA